MRIIAGEFRSRVLQAPRGWNTRPTSDRLRETLFNVLGSRVDGARFLDLYAGTGAAGLEALSRGAREAVFVEQGTPALAAIRANIAALGVGARARVEAKAVRRWLGTAARSMGASFEVVFLDPPYDRGEEYAATLEFLGGEGAGLLAENAIVVAEYRRAKPGGFPGPESYGALRQGRLLEQGEAALRFFAAGPV